MLQAVRFEASDEPSPNAVRDQLARLEASQAFHGSSRLTEFLRFVVNETLDGAGASLKEIIVGQAIYPREPPYDPTIDSVVRVEARRLRQKLDDHYLGAGSDDPVVVSMPSGSYMPVFALNSRGSPGADKPRSSELASDTLKLMILPVLSVSADPTLADFADAFTDELITELETKAEFLVVPRAVAFGLRSRSRCLVTLAGELQLDAVLHGVVRAAKSGPCMTIELADVHGFLLASERLEMTEGFHGEASIMCRGLVRDLCDTRKTTGLNHGLRTLRRDRLRMRQPLASRHVAGAIPA